MLTKQQGRSLLVRVAARRYEMKPDDLGRLSLFEMAAHGITDLLVQGFERVHFREDRGSQRAR